jgi:hypothetical protein
MDRTKVEILIDPLVESQLLNYNAVSMGIFSEEKDKRDAPILTVRYIMEPRPKSEESSL